MATTLQLTQSSFCGHFALEMLDRTLDTAITDLDLERSTLY